MPYKAIVFDFFGVVCSEISPFWFEEHFAEKGKALRSQYLRPADSGLVSQKQLFQELSELAGVSPEEIEKDWLAHAHFNTELIALIKELKSDYTIGLLSNAMSTFFHTVTALSGILPLFDAIVISSEVGYAKPERGIYEVMLERLQIEPQEILFIDDNRRNIEGADKVGIKGHLYTSVQDLRDLLGK